MASLSGPLYGVFKAPFLGCEIIDLYNKYRYGIRTTKAENYFLISKVVATALNAIALCTNFFPQIKLIEFAARVVSIPLCCLTNESLFNKVEYIAECAFGFMRIAQERPILQQSNLAFYSSQDASIYLTSLAEFICHKNGIQKLCSWIYDPVPLPSDIPPDLNETPIMPVRPSIFSWPFIIKWLTWVPLEERPIKWQLGDDISSEHLPKNWKELCEQMKNLENLSFIPSYLECDASNSAERLTRCSITKKLTTNPVGPVVGDSYCGELPFYDEDAFAKWQKEHPDTPPPNWPENLISWKNQKTTPAGLINKVYLPKIKESFFKNSSINLFIFIFHNLKDIIITPLVWNLISGGGNMREFVKLRDVPSQQLKAPICPITHAIIRDPVEDPTSEGARIFYERMAIIDALKYSEKSPMTRKPLTLDMLRECRDVVKAIFKEGRNWYQPLQV